MQQLMELDMPAQDKLYYTFIQGNKDPRKLFQAMEKMFETQQIKGSKESFEIIVALSKKLTDNAYFAEAKLLNQLTSSNFQQSFQILEEGARIAFVFEDFKGCVDINKKAINLKTSQGMVGPQLESNYCNMGLAYYELQDFNEAMNALNQALQFNPRSSSAMLNLALVHKKLGALDKAASLLDDIIKKVDPRDASAYNNLGNILHEQGKHE
jgi:tetratricopeptide (TPR) repeat protein